MDFFEIVRLIKSLSIMRVELLNEGEEEGMSVVFLNGGGQFAKRWRRKYGKRFRRWVPEGG